MISRRQFLHTAAAGVVTLTRPETVRAARIDLIIRGGRVIDPSLRLDGIRDVGIADGRIAAVEPNLAADAAETLDARGRLVVPGLIDIHTHYAREKEGPLVGLSDGVTGWIDAGSQGADHIADMVAIARSSPQPGRVLMNIGRSGILPDGDTMDLKLADVAVAKAAIARHRDFIVGIKARLSNNVAGANDVEVLRRAQEVASAFSIPVMIHMGQTVSSMSKLLPLLKRGDIVTHMYAPPPNSILDESGRILPEVLAARKRGVWFDVANGRNGHIRWDTVDQIVKTGFWPDTLSTDGNSMSRTTGVIDFPNVMSKFLMVGMPLPQVIACATLNPSRIFPLFHDRGTLKVGAPADVAILELREGTFEFLDNYENKRAGKQRLFPSGTVLGGKQVRRT
jgi:dihydroorotase